MNMEAIVSAEQVTPSLIDRLIDLANSLPLPAKPESANLDLIEEQSFNADLEQKNYYKTKLVAFLLKARDRLELKARGQLERINMAALLKAIINNFKLVLRKLDFDEYSPQGYSFEQIIHSPQNTAQGHNCSESAQTDCRITMAPPKQSSFVSSNARTNDDDEKDDDKPGGSASMPAAGGKNAGIVDQF